MTTWTRKTKSLILMWTSLARLRNNLLVLRALTNHLTTSQGFLRRASWIVISTSFADTNLSINSQKSKMRTFLTCRILSSLSCCVSSLISTRNGSCLSILNSKWTCGRLTWTVPHQPHLWLSNWCNKACNLKCRSRAYGGARQTAMAKCSPSVCLSWANLLWQRLNNWRNLNSSRHRLSKMTRLRPTQSLDVTKESFYFSPCTQWKSLWRRWTESNWVAQLNLFRNALSVIFQWNYLLVSL